MLIAPQITGARDAEFYRRYSLGKAGAVGFRRQVLEKSLHARVADLLRRHPVGALVRVERVGTLDQQRWIGVGNHHAPASGAVGVVLVGPTPLDNERQTAVAGRHVLADRKLPQRATQSLEVEIRREHAHQLAGVVDGCRARDARRVQRALRPNKDVRLRPRLPTGFDRRRVVWPPAYINPMVGLGPVRLGCAGAIVGQFEMLVVHTTDEAHCQRLLRIPDHVAVVTVLFKPE